MFFESVFSIMFLFECDFFKAILQKAIFFEYGFFIRESIVSQGSFKPTNSGPDMQCLPLRGRVQH